MAARRRRAADGMSRLVATMATLRSARGCPWDRKQTHETLRPFLLEETYEALDTLDRHDLDALPGELGDVMFQCVFHAQIAGETGRFDLGDALEAINAKLIRRHPHVFLPDGRPLPPARKRRGAVRTPKAVLQQWEALKAREQQDAGAPKRVLSGVPRSLPALLRAHEIGTRVAAVGFDWTHPGDVVDKIDEEVRELRDALGESPARAAEELGDLLFSIANLSRKLGIEPEAALRAANDKFTQRFGAVEADLQGQGRSVHGAALADLEAAWTRAKAQVPATVRAAKAATSMTAATAKAASPAKRARA